MWTEAVKLDDVAPGGVKSVRLMADEIACAAATARSTPSAGVAVT